MPVAARILVTGLLILIKNIQIKKMVVPVAKGPVQFNCQGTPPHTHTRKLPLFGQAQC